MSPTVSPEDLHVTGTLMWYYYICPRQVWFMGRQIEPDHDDPNVAIGREIHREAYARAKRNLSLGWMRLDVVQMDGSAVVITEVKKSSRSVKSAQMQLALYLQTAREAGLEARGELRFPKEKKRVAVELTPELVQELETAKQRILAIIQQPVPPPLERTHWCRKCAYAELCFS
ncbi:MAG: CRISPR-associated protein Cas4 [Limnochordaceae bacterium]|nr:CRISPR-associated protein Cas4 [Limnochordaceae bacterium]